MFQKKEDSDSFLIESRFWPNQECTDNCTDTDNNRKYTEHIRQVCSPDKGICKKENSKDDPQNTKDSLSPPASFYAVEERDEPDKSMPTHQYDLGQQDCTVGKDKQV